MSTLTRYTTPSSLADWAFRDIPQFVRGLDWPEIDAWTDRDGMRVEEFRENGDLIVRAEVPGIDPDKDVEITVADHSLCIRVERKARDEQERKGFYRSEFRYGQFTRQIALPAGFDEKDIKAHYKDGILEVKLPIGATESPAHRIQVERD